MICKEKCTFLFFILFESINLGTSFQSHAENSSIFFTQKEISDIAKIQKSLEKNKTHNHILSLDAVVWNSNESWTAWINDTPWNSDTIKDGIKILSAKIDSITLSLINEEKEEKIITLKLNQKYNRQSNTISEGRE